MSSNLGKVVAYEYVGNLHIHTSYSDGYGSHEDIALAAIKAGLDFAVVTDHNVWVGGMDGYRYLDRQRVLLLTGEEIHDQAREPQKNHLLVYETLCELGPHAHDPQGLINAVAHEGGLSFIAHPTDPSAPAFNEDDLSWVDWEVDGFNGLELWNFMSEFKGHLTSLPRSIFYAYTPALIACGPYPGVLERWDRLLASGKKIVAIGGTDAHATPVRLGPFRRTIFPYEFLFKTINTHVLLREPLTGDFEIDRRRLFHALREGNCFVGYDLPHSTRGFRFSAQGEKGEIEMGETTGIRFGVTLKISVPKRAEIRLICDGEEIHRWDFQETAVHTVNQPGVYRAEAYLRYKGKLRGWIFSNPIYINSR
jgi:hypothetical protein